MLRTFAGCTCAICDLWWLLLIGTSDERFQNLQAISFVGHLSGVLPVGGMSPRPQIDDGQNRDS
jgi:hypothetical protein